MGRGGWSLVTLTSYKQRFANSVLLSVCLTSRNVGEVSLWALLSVCLGMEGTRCDRAGTESFV